MTYLVTLGDALPGWVLQSSLWTALVLAAVIAIDGLLVRRVGASWRSLLYAAVLLRVCLPLSVTQPVGLVRDLPPALSDAVPADAPPVTPAGAGQPVHPWHGRWRPALLGLGYVAGVSILALVWGRGRRRLARVAAEAAPAGSVDVGGRTIAVHSHQAWGPGVIGLRSPRIVVPAPLLVQGDGAVPWVLRHESAHLRRGDHVTLPLLQLVVIALWPIAPLWLALLRYRRLVEMACDELAIAGEPARRRQEYGELLLSFASRPRRAAGFESLQEVTMTRDVVSRIVELRHHRRFASRLQGIVVLPLTLLAALVVGPGAVGSPTEPPPAPAAGRSCRERATAVVDHFRHLELVKLEEKPGGLALTVELTGGEPRDVPSVIATLKDSLERFGFVVQAIKGLPLRKISDQAAAFPFELVVDCTSPEAEKRRQELELGLPCPGAPADAEASLRQWFAARGAKSPRFADVQLSVQGSDLRLAGSADAIDAITALVGELEGCASVSKVDLKSVRASKDGTYAFEMVATLGPRAR